MEISTFITNQLGKKGNIYWNWCTVNLWPSQGYYVNGTVTPWCAEFVTCMLEWTGSRAPWFPSPTAFDARDIPLSHRHYAQSIRPLDIVSFDWDRDESGDHVGIVLEVYPWGCRTIEGNSAEVVLERDRYWDDILFGIRPEWNGDEMISEEDKRDIARYCAEYTYGDRDREEDRNMYNVTHWGYDMCVDILSMLEEVKACLAEMKTR